MEKGCCRLLLGRKTEVWLILTLVMEQIEAYAVMAIA
jgi:hypothetical protein